MKIKLDKILIGEISMEYKIREYPQFSACGLNCGLCPRYYTKGQSRCPGCAGKGFTKSHCSCSILSCCQRKGLEYCFLCDEYPCKKYDGEGIVDSFITHMNIFRDADKASSTLAKCWKSAYAGLVSDEYLSSLKNTHLRVTWL